MNSVAVIQDGPHTVMVLVEHLSADEKQAMTHLHTFTASVSIRIKLNTLNRFITLKLITLYCLTKNSGGKIHLHTVLKIINRHQSSLSDLITNLLNYATE